LLVSDVVTNSNDSFKSGLVIIEIKKPSGNFNRQFWLSSSSDVILQAKRFTDQLNVNN